MKRTTILLAASFLAIASASTANAGISLVYSSGGTASGGATYLNFDSYVLGAGVTNDGPLSNPVKVTVTSNAQVVTGSVVNLYAAPSLSGNNNLNFGATYSGNDNTPFITTGRVSGNGSVTFEFDNLQKYFGLLWGSIDTHNTLKFYNGALLVGTFTGSDASASPDGNQGATGTHYVNINASSGFEFNKVVATSDNFAFEFDNVAYGQANFSDPLVPEPASLVVWALLGLTGFVAYRRNRKAA